MKWVLGSVIVLAGHAAADDTPTSGAEPRLIEPTSRPVPASTRPEPERFSHEGQFEVSARFGLGYRAIVPYEDNTYCGKTSNDAEGGIAPACVGRAPFALDFELGYGIAAKIDLLLELRLGLEPDFDATPTGDDGPHTFHLSPGARFFFNDAGRSKLFTTAQIVLDISNYKAPGGGDRGADFGVRNLSGLWFDLDRAYGFYVFVGGTAGFVRWFDFQLDAGVGIQGRYP